MATVGRPLCVVPITAQPPLGTMCPIDNKPRAGAYLCENGGVCGTNPLRAQFPPGALFPPLNPPMTCTTSTDCTTAGYPYCDPAGGGVCTSQCGAIPRTPCGASGVCPAGTACVAGFCGVACTGSASGPPCGADEICNGVAPVKTKTACAVAGDCYSVYGPTATCEGSVCQIPAQPGVCTPTCGTGNVCTNGQCGASADCNATSCAARANDMVKDKKLAKPLGPERFGICDHNMCQCADGYYGGLCEITANDARCPTGFTGFDCKFPTSRLELGTCACPDGWTGPTCATGTSAPADVWCVGSNAGEALAAFDVARTICAINRDSQPTNAHAAVLDSSGQPTLCTTGSVSCQTNADCGLSRCNKVAPTAAGVCEPLACPGAPGAKACSATAPCDAGAVCNEKNSTCEVPCDGPAGCAADTACNRETGTCQAFTCNPGSQQCTPARPPVPLGGGLCTSVMERAADADARVGAFNPGSKSYTRVPLQNEIGRSCASTCDDGSVCKTTKDCNSGQQCYPAPPCPAWTECDGTECRPTSAAPDHLSAVVSNTAANNALRGAGTAPVAGVVATSCTAGDLQLQDAIGSNSAVQPRTFCDSSGACAPNVYGSADATASQPATQLSPPYPAQYCGRLF
jgi:hypothetical protein